MSNAIVLPYHHTARGARAFDSSSSQYLDIPSPLLADSGLPFVISCWAKLETYQNNGRVWQLSDRDSTSAYFVRTRGGPVFWYSAAGRDCITTKTLETDRWYHVVAGSRASNDHFIYVDADLSTGGTNGSGTSLTGIDTLSVGSGILNSTPGSYWDGDIADLAVWSTSHMSAGEFRALASGRAPWEVQPDRLVFYNPLGCTGVDIPSWVKVKTGPITEVNGPTHTTGPPRESVTTAKRFLPIPGEAGPPTLEASGTTTSRVDTQGDINVTWPSIAASGTTTSRVDTQGDITYTPPGISASGTTTSRVDTQGDINYTPPALSATGIATSRVDTQGDITVTWPTIAASGTTTSRVDTLGDVNYTPPVGTAQGTTTSRVDTLGDIYAQVAASGVTTSRVDTLGDILAAVAAVGVTTSRVDTIGDIPTGDFAPNPCRIVAAQTETRTVQSEC